MKTLCVLLLASSTALLGKPPEPTQLSGIINDHTAVSAGSWELHGEWTLKAKGDNKADFSAVLQMERSDYWALTGGNPDARSAHTHHVTIVDGTITPITGGFEVTGTATITVNGNAATFNGSTVVIDVTGGATVTYSNIKVTFQGGAAGHFGSAALAGAVRADKESDGD
jgi:hypothetical protein